MDFHRFALASGYRLTAAQTEFGRVAFDGLPGGDAEIGKTLWGCPMEGRHWPVVAAVCGARSGKTLLSALRSLQLMMTVPLDAMGHGEDAVVPIVCPDLKLARQVLSFMVGAVDVHCRRAGIATEALVTARDADGFTMRREGGREIRAQALAASRGGRSVRGRWFPCAVLDEACFFRDSTYRINDAEIFGAVSPRIMPDVGQLLLLSTPYLELGLLYEMWKRNWGHPVDALVAHAPTLLMRLGDPGIAAIVERERIRDPLNARREFDAEFMSAASNTFFDHRSISGSVKELSLPVPHIPGATVSVGADFAFRRNSSALVVVQRTRDDRYVVSEVQERRPVDGALSPRDTVREFADIARSHGTDSVVADNHYRETVVDHLVEFGLSLVPSPDGSRGRAERFQVSRTLFHAGKVDLPDHDRLLRQLKEVTYRPTQGGGVSIDLQTWQSGEHGDLADALVMALWRASRDAPDAEETPAERKKREIWEGMDPLERREHERETAEMDRRLRMSSRSHRRT